MWLKIVPLVETNNIYSAGNTTQTVILKATVTKSEIEMRCRNGDSNSG